MATPANQVTLKITRAMRYGSERRSLPIANYLEQLADADVADIHVPRLARIARSLVQSRETAPTGWRSQDRRKMSPAKKKAILSLLFEERLPPSTVAKRCDASEPTVYRLRAEEQKKRELIAAPEKPTIPTAPSARRFTAEEKTEMQRMMLAGVPPVEIRAHFRTSKQSIIAVRRAMGLPTLPSGRRRKAAQ